MRYSKYKTAALVLEALRNLQLEAVKGHLLFEVRRAEFKATQEPQRLIFLPTFFIQGKK